MSLIVDKFRNKFLGEIPTSVSLKMAELQAIVREEEEREQRLEHAVSDLQHEVNNLGQAVRNCRWR